MWDIKLVNIVLLGISFFLIFTAFQTGGNIQKTVVDSIKQITHDEYKGDGFVSLCMIYTAFSAANWIAPSVVAAIGPKYSMILGGSTYCIFMAQFLVPTTAGLYLASLLMGVGAAIIWTGQGNFLTINSTESTIDRNSGIFWALLQCSLLFGNLFVFFMFSGETLDLPVIRTTYGTLSLAGVVGLSLLLTLRNPNSDSEQSSSCIPKLRREVQKSKESATVSSNSLVGNSAEVAVSHSPSMTLSGSLESSSLSTTDVDSVERQAQSMTSTTTEKEHEHAHVHVDGDDGDTCDDKKLPCSSSLEQNPSSISTPASSKIMNPKQALVNSFQLFKTTKMMLLSATFFYTGVLLSFYSGVYGPALGYTHALGSNSKKYIGISGMLTGVGEIVGGALFGLLGERTTRRGRDPVVMLGYCAHMLSFFLIYINIPASAAHAATDSPGYIDTRLWIALLCSLLLGFGDSCYNTQCFTLLGTVYAHDSAPAFALFKFTQSVAAALAFLYSNWLDLHIQLLILAITASGGTLTFCTVEWQARKKLNQALERDLVGVVATSEEPDNKHLNNTETTEKSPATKES